MSLVLASSRSTFDAKGTPVREMTQGAGEQRVNGLIADPAAYGSTRRGPARTRILRTAAVRSRREQRAGEPSTEIVEVRCFICWAPVCVRRKYQSHFGNGVAQFPGAAAPAVLQHLLESGGRRHLRRERAEQRRLLRVPSPALGPGPTDGSVSSHGRILCPGYLRTCGGRVGASCEHPDAFANQDCRRRSLCRVRQSAQARDPSLCCQRPQSAGRHRVLRARRGGPGARAPNCTVQPAAVPGSAEWSQGGGTNKSWVAVGAVIPSVAQLERRGCFILRPTGRSA